LPVIFSDQTYASRDIYNFFNPRRFFAAETIRSGTIPLWNPYLASGVPFLANLQGAVFYPLSIIYYILPFQLGFKCFIVLHYYLAGLFMFLLMRRWRYDTYSSCISALVFMFGGYMISILDNVAFLTSAVWLPLIVLLFDRSLSAKKLGYLIITGVVIGLQILGGDASFYIFSTFIFMVAYLLYYLITVKSLSMKERGKIMMFLPLAWVIGICLAAIQLIPFMEFVSYSTRMEGFSYENITKWSFHPLELIQLLVPYFYGSTVPMCRWFGQFWLDTFYIGIVPLLLVIFSLCCLRKKFNYFLLIIIFFSLFMAFGKNNPLYSWSQYVPVINMLHYPVKYLFLAGFSLALLSGIGCSALFSKLENKEEIKGFTICLFTMNLVFITAFFIGSFMEERLFTIFKSIYPQTLFFKIVGVESSFLAIFKGYSWFVILLTTVSILMVLAIKGKIAVKKLKIVLITIVLIDLIFLGKPKDNTIKSSLYTMQNETVQLLKNDSSHFRIFSLSYITFEGFMNIPKTPFNETFMTLQSFMTPNLSIYFHIDAINEYAALLVKRYYLLYSPMREFFKLEQMDTWQMNYCKEILNMLNVKYVISSFRLGVKDLKLVQAGKVKIYENPSALPRAYLVPKATILKDDEEVLKTIQEVNFNPKKSILITQGEYKKAQNDFIGNEKHVPVERFKGEVINLKYLANSVEITTDGNDSSFLVLADNYYPGWKVSVNGNEKNILRVNYNLRGVILPRGENRVQFSFEPLSFKIGAAVSLL
ncbi:MAG: YfhO family protein, partial [Deltaproteobacteria bacterium]|nr:YfhO family protein [Deltaproteobacteria bacterium]